MVQIAVRVLTLRLPLSGSAPYRNVDDRALEGSLLALARQAPAPHSRCTTPVRDQLFKSDRSSRSNVGVKLAG